MTIAGRSGTPDLDIKLLEELPAPLTHDAPLDELRLAKCRRSELVRATPSLLAHVITDKLYDGLPLQRQEARFARLGRGTMSRWLQHIGLGRRQSDLPQNDNSCRSPNPV